MARKILHISSSLNGGAGIAAKNIADLQRSRGSQVKLFTRSPGYISDDLEVKKVPSSCFKKMASKYLTLIQKTFTRKEYGLLSVFSMNLISIAEVRRFDPDFIHIHNWYNILSLAQIAELSKEFRVILHLHDERIFTGGCHNTLGCEQFITNCERCPASILGKGIIRKNRIGELQTLNEFRNLGFVSPSAWLFDSHRDFILNKAKTAVIPNVLNISNGELEIVSPVLKSNKHTRVLFIAADINTSLKRLNIVIGAIEDLNRDGDSDRFELRIVGGGRILGNEPSNYIKYLGKKSSKELKIIMGESDVLVLASESENYPNVIVEAQLNGLPVISNDVGGVSEMIEHKKTGILFKGGRGELLRALKDFASMNQEQRLKMAQKAIEHQRIKQDPIGILGKIEALVMEL
jgi:glycosyltransferase involved in cell wall biosynthesis